jgi:ectoine hydroxylase-related dioxygenase (phytanoyl-CoA dioxygenase family)
MPRGGGTLIASGSHRHLERFHRALAPDDRPKHATLRKRFSGSHPWLAELTGVTSATTDRVPRFMETTTEIDGVPLRVLELTGGPGDAVLCHPSIFHAVSPNRADVPRFMRVKPIGKRTE